MTMKMENTANAAMITDTSVRITPHSMTEKNICIRMHKLFIFYSIFRRIKYENAELFF